MRTIQLLDNDDIIQPDDWIRPLHIISMSGGMSDHYDFTPTDNNSKWQRVKYVLGKCWHGSKAGMVNKAFSEFNRYEFVRGDIPTSHRETTKGLWDHSKDPDEDEDDYNDDIPF